MPELPEVEVLVRSLRPRLVGRRIEAVQVLRDRLIEGRSPRSFIARLRGRRIEAIRRRGKTIWVELEGGGHWLTHLRMTGWLRWAEACDRDDGHVLARFDLGGEELRYRDPRRFGRMWWTGDPALHFDSLGPEPLESGFSAKALERVLARRRAPIKQALLDPGVVAGIGNNYASEACFHAGLDPLTPAREVADPAGLRRAIRKTLRRAIRLGATVRDHDGEFFVYGREGKPCLRCGAPIGRFVVGQRSTFSCPRCQTNDFDRAEQAR